MSIVEETFYLCLRIKERGYPKLAARIVTRSPALAVGEVSLALTVRVPKALFQRPTLHAIVDSMLQLSDELQSAIESLAAHRGDVEPVAWINQAALKSLKSYGSGEFADYVAAWSAANGDKTIPLYLHPPQAQAGAGDAEELQFYRDECALYRGKVDLLMAEVSQADEEGRAFIHKDTIVAIITHDPDAALEAQREPS